MANGGRIHVQFSSNTDTTTCSTPVAHWMLDVHLLIYFHGDAKTTQRTLWAKKDVTLFLLATSPNGDWFSESFHWKFSSKFAVKSPAIRLHLSAVEHKPRILLYDIWRLENQVDRNACFVFNKNTGGMLGYFDTTHVCERQIHKRLDGQTDIALSASFASIYSKCVLFVKAAWPPLSTYWA